MSHYDPLYYLKERDPTIRNQLIPVQVEQDSFLDYILKYLRFQFDHSSKLGPNENLEIEMKLGSFIAKDMGFYQMLQNFKHISKLNHIIISDFAQFYSFQPNYLLPPWTDFYFDSSSFPPSFLNLLSYFRSLANTKSSQSLTNIENMYIGGPLQNINENLRLDLLLLDNQRVSIYFDGKKEIIKKVKGDSIDMMKEFKQCRLSTNFESSFPLPEDFDSFLSSNAFRTIRFKYFMNFRYQFIDVNISRVYQFPVVEEIYDYFNRNQRENGIDWKTLLIELLQKLFEVEKKAQSNVTNQKEQIQNNQRKCEIEFEICDLQFFKENSAYGFKRLLRNADSFFYLDKVSYDLLHQQIQKVHPQIQRHTYSPPLIGNYLQETYRIGQKYM